MTDFDEIPEEISKTQLKQQAHDLQKLGENLVGLTDAHLKRIPMDEELAEAIGLARRINRKKDGFRRQLQFIGKLLRGREIQAIQEALAKIESHHAEDNAKHHLLEQWREKIIVDGDAAIDQILESQPQMSRQQLRQLYRQIQTERKKQAPPKYYRALFQYLKTHADLG